MLYAVVLMLVVCCKDACVLHIHRMPEESVVVTTTTVDNVSLPSHVIQCWLMIKKSQPDLMIS